MAGNRVALRFAKSLFDLAIEQNQLEAVFADMQLIESTAKQSHDLVVLFNSPVVATDAKKKIIDQVFKASVSVLTTSFLHIITTKRRESYVPAIAAEFVDLYNLKKGIEAAILTTAVPVDDATRAQMIDLVKKQTGKGEVKLVEKIDPAIIGGFILRYGDHQVDTSVAGKMRKLKKEFQNNLYVKEY